MVRTICILLAVILAGCSRAPEEAQQTGNIVPKTVLPSSPKLLAQGRTVFERNCAPCHGLKGDGQGPAAYLLYPKPRDFLAARYRLVSTWDSAPMDADIFQTISRGMPGSAMPSWAHLTEEARWALVHYVKAFSKNPFEFQADHPAAERV
jgi:cytochrome c oxidase cbb3-type subunit 2